MMDYTLKKALDSGIEFYHSEKKVRIVVVFPMEEGRYGSYTSKCYDLACGCAHVTTCDIIQGETIHNVIKYDDLKEIGKEEFKQLWESCAR